MVIEWRSPNTLLTLCKSVINCVKMNHLVSSGLHSVPMFTLLSFVLHIIIVAVSGILLCSTVGTQIPRGGLHSKS